jgi:hypothetical protein
MQCRSRSVPTSGHRFQPPYRRRPQQMALSLFLRLSQREKAIAPNQSAYRTRGISTLTPSLDKRERQEGDKGETREPRGRDTRGRDKRERQEGETRGRDKGETSERERQARERGRERGYIYIYIYIYI